MIRSGKFSHINTAILDLQASGLQNFHRPIKRLAQLLHYQDLRAVNQQLTAIVDVNAFLQISYQTGGSMVGSQKLLWPDDVKEQLGLFLGIVDKLAADKNFGIEFCTSFLLREPDDRWHTCDDTRSDHSLCARV